MKEKYIYLVFSKTGTWLSRSIGLVTKTNYSHVSLSLDPYFNTMYSFGRTNPDNPFSGGLTIENIHEGVFQKSKLSQCLIYKVQVTTNQFDRLKSEIDKFYNSDIRYKYNFIGLFGVLMDKPLYRDTHYFCSEFITTLLERSDIWHSPKIPQLTQPTDLMRIKNKEVIYEGLVRELDTIYTPGIPIMG